MSTPPLFDDKPSSSLANRGVAAAGYLAGGAALFVLGVLPTFLGIIFGAAACLFGIGTVFSRDKADRLGGTVLFAGGALSLLSKFPLFAVIPGVAPLSRFGLFAGAFAFLGMGLLQGLKFLRGLRARS